MFAVDAPDNLATVLTAAVVAVPSVIAAVASLRSNRKADAIRTEVTSPNGTTTAQAIQDIKLSLAEVATKQEEHALADIKVHAEQDSRIEAIAKQLGSPPPSAN